MAWPGRRIPRIKASNWTPDIYRDEDFYKADFWLGAAWKAMPADLSRPGWASACSTCSTTWRTGARRSSVLGEVDVFKIDHTHELYGHMNVNYLKARPDPPVRRGLAARARRAPRGQVLRHAPARSGCASSPSAASRAARRWRCSPATAPRSESTLDWTFPLRFAEVVSGDGTRVYRERIDLAETGSFGERTLTLTPDLAGQKWVRVAAWDIAANGSFTQPVWLVGPTAGREP